jgi:hypothetical protein
MLATLISVGVTPFAVDVPLGQPPAAGPASVVAVFDPVEPFDPDAPEEPDEPVLPTAD